MLLFLVFPAIRTDQQEIERHRRERSHRHSVYFTFVDHRNHGNSGRRPAQRPPEFCRGIPHGKVEPGSSKFEAEAVDDPTPPRKFYHVNRRANWICRGLKIARVVP